MKEREQENQTRRPLLSVVSPVYQAAELVSRLVSEIALHAEVVDPSFELILVEDGSRDESWAAIRRAARGDSRVRGVKLSRNFGQHAAITAGLSRARGEYIVVIDCDLQENPSYIPELYRKAQEGFDIVYTTRKVRQHGWWKGAAAAAYYALIRALTDARELESRPYGTYSLVRRRVVDALLQMEDVHRHYILLLQWLGFSSTSIEIEHEPRPSGTSSYSPVKLLRHAVNGIVSQSTKLLGLSVLFGFLISFASLAGCVLLVVLYFFQGFKEGWASLAVLTLFCTGCVLCAVGTASLYLGKVFEQVRRRPLYLVDSTTDLPAEVSARS